MHPGCTTDCQNCYSTCPPKLLIAAAIQSGIEPSQAAKIARDALRIALPESHASIEQEALTESLSAHLSEIPEYLRKPAAKVLLNYSFRVYWGENYDRYLHALLNVQWLKGEEQLFTFADWLSGHIKADQFGEADILIPDEERLVIHRELLPKAEYERIQAAKTKKVNEYLNEWEGLFKARIEAKMTVGDRPEDFDLNVTLNREIEMIENILLKGHGSIAVKMTNNEGRTAPVTIGSKYESPEIAQYYQHLILDNNLRGNYENLTSCIQPKDVRGFMWAIPPLPIVTVALNRYYRDLKHIKENPKKVSTNRVGGTKLKATVLYYLIQGQCDEVKTVDPNSTEEIKNWAQENGENPDSFYVTYRKVVNDKQLRINKKRAKELIEQLGRCPKALEEFTKDCPKEVIESIDQQKNK